MEWTPPPPKLRPPGFGRGWEGYPPLVLSENVQKERLVGKWGVKRGQGGAGAPAPSSAGGGWAWEG